MSHKALVVIDIQNDITKHYWRKVHEKFFADELKTINQQFNERIELVCEEFEVVG